MENGFWPNIRSLCRPINLCQQDQDWPPRAHMRQRNQALNRDEDNTSSYSSSEEFADSGSTSHLAATEPRQVSQLTSASEHIHCAVRRGVSVLNHRQRNGRRSTAIF